MSESESESEKVKGLYPDTMRDRMPADAGRSIYIDRQAMPNYTNWSHELLLLWQGSDDDLVRFVYGNQGPLFAEDAVVFKTWTPERGDHLYIRRDVGDRIRGSWEASKTTTTTPIHQTAPTVTTTSYQLTDEDVATIETALEDMAERMAEQQRATSDYTPNELRDAQRRRNLVRFALRLEDQS